ncbi:Matrilin-4 [Cladorrhinum sp. PSN332]|nr:Matrilin-4 [Cladorrhinum sp. PSN332]
MSTTPIPVASVGANPAIAKELQAKLLPEYNIVHICFDPASATAELPLVCSGDRDIPPSSGLGTNAGLPPAERLIPKAIIFGGGVSDDDAQAITQAVHAKVPEIKALHVTKQDILNAGGQGPNPEIISAVLKKKLVELGDLSDSDA